MPDTDTGQIQHTQTEPEIPMTIGELHARREKRGGFLGWDRENAEKPAETASAETADAPAPTGDEKPAEAKAPESAPAKEAEPAKGDQPKAPDGGAKAKPADKDPVAALMEKYKSEDRLADAYLHLQRAFTEKTEDAKKLQEFINGHFDVGPDGSLDLKPEAAARRLGKERQNGGISLDEKAVRAEVEGRYRSLAEDTEDPEAFLKLPKTQALIEADTKRAVAEKKLEAQHAMNEEGLRIAQISTTFFKANPDAQKYQDAMDEWLDELPMETAMKLVRDGGQKFLMRLYRACKAQGDLEPRVREAFDEGRRVEKDSVKLKAGAQGESGPASPRRDLGPGEGDEGFKARVVGSGKRGVMDALLKGAK